MKFEEFSTEFANKCDKCNGKKYIYEGENRYTCHCQLKALAKYRYELIPIDSVLRTFDWTDYNVHTPSNKTILNWQHVRDTALGYCFSPKSISDISKCEFDIDDVEYYIKHRITKSQIIERLNEGANLAILGEDFTGKTFLASLIAREVVYASVFISNFDFRWISFNSLINSLSFDKSNNELVDDLLYTNDFLVLDNVSIPKQASYKLNVLNELFYERLNNRKPVIITGSKLLESSDYKLREQLGDDFFRLFNSDRTVKISLNVESNG